MANPNESFGKLVRRSDTQPAIDHSCQTVVVIEHPRKRWEWSQRKDYYVVTQDRSGDAVARGQVTIEIEDHARGLALPLKADYRAVVSRDGLPATIAQRLVDSIGRGHDPQGQFEQRLRRAVSERVAASGGLKGLLNSFDAIRPEIVRELEEGLLRETGLQASLRLEAQPATAFQKVKSIKEDFVTEIADHSGTIRIEAQVDLEAATGLLSYAKHPALAQTVTKVIEHIRAFAKALTLQEVHFEAESIEKNLRDSLSQLVSGDGRTISHLHLRCHSPITQAVQRTQRIAPKPFTFERVEYPRPITVECELQVELSSLGRYVRHGTPPLDTWAVQKFREVIERHLLDVSYIQLFRKPATNESGFQVFDRKLRETKSAMQAEAEKIGYQAFSIALRTNLDFDELRREFKIEVKNEIFELKLPDYTAALDIDVTARIEREDVIEELFHRNVDIKGEIERAIKEMVRKQLKATAPGDYYIQFRDPEQAKDGASVTDTLEDALKAFLQEQYKAAAVVSCSSRLTELDKLFKELQKLRPKITVSPQRVQLTFEATVRVIAVDLEHWNEFQNMRPTSELLIETTTNSIQEWCARFGREGLMAAQVDAIKQELNRHLRIDVARQLGLVAEVIFLERHETPEEKALHEKVLGERVRQIREFEDVGRMRIDGLKSQLEGLIAQARVFAETEQYGELDEINVRIGKLTKEIQDLNAQTSFAVTTEVVVTAGATGAKALRAATEREDPPRLIAAKAVQALPGASDPIPGSAEAPALGQSKESANE